ncbi:esterase [Paracidovorax avenae]|uniref:extracellular catalytic domain type 1 short-chain-length polyhydroxyalkanoate depolymerase n=1 Tax=Paracidovorax avenae TaxID=80867 RepID=UPI000D15BB83|nr:PHB depolymerase family esterase [Paracidovorax avenae]AVS80935.1 esterase [Paracidovorax avenae]AVS91268.1 esterase [Paracidovorax avenae]AVT16172.1 esterase [Paracidovorax avenae]AVT20103.1 esterase [Paracidovorax avenae]
MKNPFHARAPTYDAAAIAAIIDRALASAGLGASSMPLQDLGAAIHRAMGSTGAGRVAIPAETHHDASIDVPARVIDSNVDAGSFERHEFRSPAGTRSYKLFVPAHKLPAPCPLIVMLHGCTQSADDFAAGTQMNRLAQARGFLVAYPEQPAQANASKCWNWFQPQDQRRDAGEPALIAGIVQEVAARHAVDPGRIFVAGLSAGAAMAVVMGETYPELFAGIGAHSGLPYGSARDIPSALAAMKGGRRGAGGHGTRADHAAGQPHRQMVQPVPIIVFHGDRDHTVQHSNGVQIVEHARRAHGTSASSTQTGEARGGRKYSRTVHTCGQGHACIESWTLHGAGHAWSGGDANGSYTDARGPDASVEIVRFFLDLPATGTRPH